MTNQHRATPDEWAQQEDWANRSVFSDSSCLLELRARIEALEVGQQPLVNYAPVKPEYRDKLDRLIEQDRSNPQQLALVDRLAVALLNAPRNSNADAKARAAILEVAAWLRAEDDGLLAFGLDWATRLQREANR
jgi:hypothetical protein